MKNPSHSAARGGTDVSGSLAWRTRSRGMILMGIRWILPISTILLMVFFTIESNVFLTPGNLLSVATQNAPTFIVASVFSLLLMAGYVDLSVGSSMALVGVLAGLGVNAFGILPGILIGLATGTVVGLLNGLLIGGLGFSPIVVTLGGLAAARGLAQYLGQGSIYGFPKAFGDFGAGAIGGIPTLTVIAAIVCIACVIATTRFPIGRQIIAIGVNRQAAFLLGIRVKPLITVLYTLTGLSVGLAGVLEIAWLNSAPSGTLGSGFEVIVLTAVLLGGIPFNGGNGSVWRVLVGVWLISVLSNGLILLNVGTELSSIITGGVLVLAAGLEAIRFQLSKT